MRAMAIQCECGCEFQTQTEKDVSFCPSCGKELFRTALTERILPTTADAGHRLAAGRPLSRLGEFRIVREIGRGGMGHVYEAVQEPLERHVALKVLPAAGDRPEEHVARFRREAAAIAQLQHENIVQIYTYGEEGGCYYFAMEYIRGNNLETELRTSKMSLERKVDVAIQIAGALAKAHSVGVIHRDIKPGNILVEPGGKIWVTDFGLAKWSQREGMTLDGTLLGTPEYMSPEQCEGRPLGAATDIYSFGILLYRMLSGTVPFRAETPLAILFQHVRDKPRDLREINPDVPLDLGALVMRCLAKNPENRFASAAELAAALEAFQRDYEELRSLLSRDGVDTESLVVSALRAEDGNHRTNAYKRGLGYVRATCLVADMENFFRLATSQPPEVVTRTLERFFGEVRRTIESRGGTVIHLFGDTILAAFGAPIPLADHWRVAVETAVELQRTTAELSATLATKVSVRIGLEEGLVLGGYVHDGKRMNYNVYGEAMGNACALEPHATRGQILIGENLHRLAQGAFEFESLGPLTVIRPNQRREIRAWRLVSPSRITEG